MNSSRDAHNAPEIVDVVSIEAIVSQHSAAVFRLARSVVQDTSLADDVTQETFIKVWRNLDSFHGESRCGVDSADRPQHGCFDTAQDPRQRH